MVSLVNAWRGVSYLILLTFMCMVEHYLTFMTYYSQQHYIALYYMDMKGDFYCVPKEHQDNGKGLL